MEQPRGEAFRALSQWENSATAAEEDQDLTDVLSEMLVSDWLRFGVASAVAQKSFMGSASVAVRIQGVHVTLQPKSLASVKRFFDAPDDEQGRDMDMDIELSRCTAVIPAPAPVAGCEPLEPLRANLPLLRVLRRALSHAREQFSMSLEGLTYMSAISTCTPFSFNVDMSREVDNTNARVHFGVRDPVTGTLSTADQKVVFAFMDQMSAITTPVRYFAIDCSLLEWRGSSCRC